jgi:pilus assembly protein Flp/PilA
MIAVDHISTTKVRLEISGLSKGEEVRSMEKIKRFLKEDEGAHAIEYGLIASLIAVAIIVGATALGGKLNTLFTNISNKIVTP